MRPFHFAFPVDNLNKARWFYTGVLGCGEGRWAEQWVDFDFFGHQLSAHLSRADDVGTNPVDGDEVPVRHFGLVLKWSEWRELSERLQRQDVSFLIQPRVRFEGEAGEQATMFVRDPAGNALEFKAFRNPGDLFRKAKAAE